MRPQPKGMAQEYAACDVAIAPQPSTRILTIVNAELTVDTLASVLQDIRRERLNAGEDYSSADQQILEDGRLVAILKTTADGDLELVRLDESEQVEPYRTFRVEPADELWTSTEIIEGRGKTLEDAIEHARERIREEAEKGTSMDRVIIEGDAVLATVHVADVLCGHESAG